MAARCSALVDLPFCVMHHAGVPMYVLIYHLTHSSADGWALLECAGVLQDSWGSYLGPFIEVLICNSCGLSGELPPEWAQDMSNLVFLDLSVNHGIVGPFPKAWTQENAFPNLQRLDLFACSLSGPLPGRAHKEHEDSATYMMRESAAMMLGAALQHGPEHAGADKASSVC